MKKLLVIFSIVFSLFSSVVAAEDSVGTISAIGGQYNDVEIVGDYAYVATGNGLHILDISNSNTSVKLGSYYANSNISALAIAGDYAYMVGSEFGLQVINISNPNALSLVGSLSTIGTSKDIYISGNYAYIADGSNGLLSIDISDPIVPSLLDTLGTTNASGVTVSDTYAYVADGSSGLRIVNISNPLNLNLKGIADTTLAYKVSTRGDYAFIADGSAGLRIIDISDKDNPAVVFTQSITGTARDIKVVGSDIYVAGSTMGLKSYRYVEPTATTPFLFFTNDDYNTDYARSVSVSGNYAYIADASIGLLTINISDKDNFVLSTTFKTIGDAYDISILGNYAFVSSSAIGLQIIDISNPASASIVKTINTSDAAKGISTQGDYAYLAAGFTGLQIIDISTLASASIVKTVNTPDYVKDVFVQGNYAYVADGNNLLIIDISTPDSASIVKTVDSLSPIDGVFVQGNYAYVANSTTNLLIIDISISDSASIVKTVDIFGIARDVFVQGDYAYVANGVNLQIIDISTLASASIVKTVNIPSGVIVNVFVQGDYAYLASGNGIYTIDISTPVNATIDTSFDTAGFSNNVAVAENHAYIADRTGGLAIIKVKMTDTDNDGIPDVTDPDDDNDGVLDNADDLPLDASESVDTDGDGIGNNADTDDDGDGISDVDEIANGLDPLDATDATQDADGDGISNADEIIAGTNPLLTQIEEFVTRFYEVILGRTPDIAGLADWSSQLEGLSKSGADIAKGFIFSAEYNIDSKTNEEYLNTLYSAFFNRAPDDGGYNNWISLMNSGTSRADVLDGFLNSQEFKNLADAYGIIANATPVELFVSRFYKQTLLRSPDTAGLADWVNRLNSGTATGSDVAFGFVFSAEFEARALNNEDFITVLYRAFFGREPDAGGFDGWLAELNAGTSREEVLRGFLGAPEFANLAEEYGIRVN